MKKIIITTVTLMAAMVSNAQSQYVFRPLKAEPDNVFDAKQYERAVADSTFIGDFNVLLSNKNLATKSDYENFTDLSAQNICKRINDTLYEIDVNDLAKTIVLVDAVNNNDYVRYSNGESSMTFQSLDWHGNITYNNNGVHNVYAAQYYYPTIKKYILQNRKTKKIIREFDFKYTYPKPFLVCVSSNDSLINLKRIRPSYYFNIEMLKQSPASFPSVFKKKDNSVLFVFDHLLRYSRVDENDELLYKLDNQKNWIHTSLSGTPSILLENIKVGKHTLFVKYATIKEKSEILTYHFTIAPN